MPITPTPGDAKTMRKGPATSHLMGQHYVGYSHTQPFLHLEMSFPRKKEGTAFCMVFAHPLKNATATCKEFKSVFGWSAGCCGGTVLEILDKMAPFEQEAREAIALTADQAKECKVDLAKERKEKCTECGEAYFRVDLRLPMHFDWLVGRVNRTENFNIAMRK
eukprot:gene5491-40_t